MMVGKGGPSILMQGKIDLRISQILIPKSQYSRPSSRQQFNLNDLTPAENDVRQDVVRMPGLTSFYISGCLHQIQHHRPQ